MTHRATMWPSLVYFTLLSAIGVISTRKKPQPPPPVFGFNFSLTDAVVLQRSPAKAAVFGILGPINGTAAVSVTVSDSDGKSYSVAAEVKPFRT